MIDLDSMITEKNQSRADWIAARKTEREELNRLSDDGITMVTDSPNVYQMYLNTQAVNPTYSASNIILAMQQADGITVLGSAERWRKLGRIVDKSAQSLKIRVSESYQRDGREHTGYKVGLVYDISQTAGRPFAQMILKEDSPQIKSAVKALINLAQVPLVTTDDMDLSSYYDSAEPTIYIQNGLSDQSTFVSLSREIVHSWIHNKGAYAEYERQECDLDATSVAYMLGRRYGISAPTPDFSLLGAQYSQLDTQDRRQMLDSIQKLLRNLDNVVARELSPQDRQQSLPPQSAKRHRPVR